jgi:predicted carbohydrate-binding protein with CBM5 and CBM33 domain
MNLRRRMAAVAAGIALAPVLVVLMPASPASAHGWITTPPSRQAMCATRRMTNCGGLEFEPQSMEAPKGARSCSGGSRFTVVDDESRNWPVNSVGSTATFTWHLTAAHRTTTWQYFLDGQIFRTFDEGNQQPPFDLSHTLTGLPGGRHKILAIWNIADTAMAFYNCVDIQVGSDGGGGGNPPPPPPPPPPGGCDAWSASAVYTANMTVGHSGGKWRAKWWTQGEEPGTTGEWGVWEHVGVC